MDTHEVSPVRLEFASEPGALDAYVARCSCGIVIANTWETGCKRDVADHLNYWLKRTVTVQIRTNNVPRDLLDWHELTPAEQAEFDYIDDPYENGSCRFFRYRGSCYDANEFQVVPLASRTAPETFERNLQSWDGFQSDSFFSGIAIRHPRENGRIDFERVIVALVLA
jgi:hypothetical protein